MHSVNSGDTAFSNSIINISAETGHKGDPIATPSTCIYILQLQVKWTFFVHNNHAGRDPNSHLFKHFVQSGHPVLDMTYYIIIEKGYRNNVRKWKVAEALLNKEMKFILNKQDHSEERKLFN